MHDDYFMSLYDNVYDVFFIKEYRICGGILPTLCKWLVADCFASRFPIFINAILIGVIATQLAATMHLWKMPQVTAFTVPLFFVWHPVIDDISAWNTMGFALTAAIYALAGFLLAWNGTRIAWIISAVCFFVSLATYQLMIPLPMVFTIASFVHIGAFQKTWEWKRSFSVAGSMILGLGSYLLYVLVISPMIFGASESSGLKSPAVVLSDWNGIWMQSLNLYLNIFFTPCSYYLGILSGLSHWYYVPSMIIALGGLGLAIGLLQKRLGWLASGLVLLTWIALPVLTVAPLWFIPLYTEWRISFILLCCQVLLAGSVIACLLATNQKLHVEVAESPGSSRLQTRFLLATSLGLTLLASVLIPVTRFDCKMRLSGYQNDLAIVHSIREFRASLPDPDLHRVVYREGDRPVLKLSGKEHALMKANYVINTYSTFSYGKLWASAMFRWYEINEDSEIAVPAEATTLEPKGIQTNFAPLPYVKHIKEQNLSIVVGNPQWYTWQLSNP